MRYWLLKSEPNVWSIDQQLKVGPKGADWDGVRNYQATNNLKKMEKGDLCFFNFGFFYFCFCSSFYTFYLHSNLI